MRFDRGGDEEEEGQWENADILKNIGCALTLSGESLALGRTRVTRVGLVWVDGLGIHVAVMSSISLARKWRESLRQKIIRKGLKSAFKLGFVLRPVVLYRLCCKCLIKTKIESLLKNMTCTVIRLSITTVDDRTTTDGRPSNERKTMM